MSVTRYRDVSAMPPIWREPNEPNALRRIAEAMALFRLLQGTPREPGVRKFRTIQEMNADRGDPLRCENPGVLGRASASTRPSQAATKALLARCDLPTEDLDGLSFEHFLGLGSADAPSGVVGLEVFGSVALLRSLAVAPEARGLGHGKTLVDAIEGYARGLGVTELYLLTTTARPFFESLGYAPADRSAAPEPIRATREFSSICPGSAAFLVKRLAPL